MKQKIINLIKNTFLTTGISLSLLSIIAFFMGGSAIFVQTVWQNLLANLCIHLTLALIHQWESKYFLLDIVIDITAVTLLILGIAWIFDWFSSTPSYILIPMVIIVYITGSIFQVFRVRQEIDFINRELHQRDVRKPLNKEK